MKQEKRFVKEALKKDELISVIAKTVKLTRSFFTENVKLVKFSAILIGVICLLSVVYLVIKNNEDKKALVVLSNAMEEYKVGKYQDALNYLKDINTKYKISRYRGTSLYYSGNCSFNLGKYDEAIEYYEKACSSNILPLMKILSKEGVAYCYEQKKDYKQVEEILLKLSKKLQVSFLTPEVLFNLARCYEMQGKIKEAEKTYQEIVDSYINSSWANQAKIKLEMLK